MLPLDPCPFCNGTNVQVFRERIYLMNNAFMQGVICRDCGGAIIDSDDNHSLNEIYRRWNKRTPNPFVIHPHRENEVPW